MSPQAFAGHPHPFHLAVLLIIEAVDAEGAAVAGAGGVDGAVVVDEVPVALELDDGLVVGVAVAGNLVEDALVFPRAVDALAHGIGRLLGESHGEAQVVPVAPLVDPRRLGVEVLARRGERGLVDAGDADGHDVAFGLHHVVLELDVVELGVTPEHVGLPVVVDPHRGVDVLPADGCVLGGHVVGDEGFRLRHEGAGGGVRHGHADGFAVDVFVLRRDVPVVFPAALDDLAGPCLAARPGEIRGLQRVGMFGEGLHVRGGEDAPLVHHVAVLVVRAFVVSGVDVHLPAVHQRGRVAQVLVLDEGVGGGGERGVFPFRRVGGRCRCGGTRQQACCKNLFHVFCFWVRKSGAYADASYKKYERARDFPHFIT